MSFSFDSLVGTIYEPEENKVKKTSVGARPNPKASSKLVLKKELLRTLDERHLSVVDGGCGELQSYGTECAYSQPMLCEPKPLAL